MELKEFVKHLKTKKYFLESEDCDVAITYKKGFKRCMEFNSKTGFCFIFNVDDRGKTDVRYKGFVESTEQFDLIDRLTS